MKSSVIRLLRTFAGALAMAMAAGSAMAGVAPHQPLQAQEDARRSGAVLAPWARPSGYSLEAMARILAPFNVSSPGTVPLPNTPFQILYKRAGECPQ